MRWIIGIVVVVVIVILGYQYFGGTRGVDVAEQAEEGAQQAAEATGQAVEEAAEQAAEATQEAGEQAQATAEQAAAVAEQATEEAVEETAAGAQQAVEEALTEAQSAALTVGDVNVGEQLTEIVQNAKGTLEGITDVQSAEAAVPTLNDINARLETLSATVDQLPEAAKKVLADVLSKRVTELKTLAESVTSQEGVGAVVTPALEPIMAKLDDWARQPA